MSHPFARKRFESVLQQHFTIRARDGASIEARLTEVRQVRKTDRFEQFSVLFVGPASPQLGQGNHRFVNAQLGELELFTVPVGPNRAGEAQYEVCFGIESEEEDGADDNRGA